jgi:hypothetical protein
MMYVLLYFICGLITVVFFIKEKDTEVFGFLATIVIMAFWWVIWGLVIIKIIKGRKNVIPCK